MKVESQMNTNQHEPKSDSVELVSIGVNSWFYSTIHNCACKIIEEQTLWGQTVCRVWLPNQDAIVRIPRSALQPFNAKLTPDIEVHRIGYIAAAAKVAEVLEGGTGTSDGPVLLAPMESNVIPLPHQIHALSRAVAGDRIRYLLADEVGLGKTIEAGLVMRELKLRGLVRRTLVVAPKGLATQWVSEMRTHFNEAFQLLLGEDLAVLKRMNAGDHARYWTQQNSLQYLDEPDAWQQVNPWRTFNQVIVSLDSVKPLEKRRGWNQEKIDQFNSSRFEDLITAGWDLVIIDESHRLGGSTDQVARYKLGRGLAEAAPYLLLLSATPHQGKSDAFHRLLTLLDAEAFPDQASVTRNRVTPFVIRTEKRYVIYDIPWNPMRLEQRIGRVDRIGQPKTVRAINFVFEDSVEFRVREVLEQKLSIIFDEFGIDKTGDVLDSAQAGELFEELFTAALLNSDSIEFSVDQTMTRLREEIREVKESSSIYDISDEPDVLVAERLRSHPLPHWVERMTLSYLKAYGGDVKQKRTWWDLTWPDGQTFKKCVFTSQEADCLSDTKLLNLENNRVRGLALNLPQITSGQPLPCVSIISLPSTISGFWGLFEVRIQAGLHRKSNLLRIPSVRRRYTRVFLSEEGKLFLPTARHIWDALQTAEANVIDTLVDNAAQTAFDRLLEAAEQAGQEVFDALQQEHMASITREEERGRVAFASRRKSIAVVGLPEVRQYRLVKCDTEETEWRKELESARQIVPEIRPLLLMRIIKGGVQ